ncbi:MAG TPA: PIN domain-containing protein [Bryobacteraceae bacterium]|nr:PIN domain-containing protein [Bryobacteraceae bacterium]
MDTSVWVELLNERRPDSQSDIDPLQFVTCGPVVQEVLQGLRETAAARQFSQAFEALPCLADPLPRHLFVAAAGIFRSGRRRGYTIRSSVHCLIAAIAIEYAIPVWHRDRDFEAIAAFTDLRTIS